MKRIITYKISMNYNKNLSSLKAEMQTLGIDAIYLGMRNTFGNYDDISDIEYFSGFSGSNGRALILKDNAILSVDGRYIKQAQKQTSGWIIKMFPQIIVTDMIKSFLKKGQILGICKYSLTYKSFIAIKDFANKFGINIKVLDKFPVISKKISGTLTSINRPNRFNKILLSDNEALLTTDPLVIGWAFNLRLSQADSNKNIIPNAVAILGNKPILFCDLNLLQNTNEFYYKNLNEFPEVMKDYNANVIKFDSTTTPFYFIDYLNKTGYKIKEIGNEYKYLCSIKDNSEIKSQKHGALLTSVAMTKILFKIDNHYINDEVEAIDEFCKELKNFDEFIDLSFNPISAFDKNTAIIHYNPKKLNNNNVNLSKDALFLFDGGGHFHGATTDMTRTIYIGNNPDIELRKQYTTVLKSIIDFSKLKFPNRCKASSIDGVARAPLWQLGVDYNFGTGHGVGICGNVHEFPAVSTNSKDELLENMIITIEPGIYSENFGIRMENMLLIKKSNITGFNEFETINFIPFCKKLIDLDLLDKDEITWLKIYYDTIINNITPFLQDDINILNWLNDQIIL